MESSRYAGGQRAFADMTVDELREVISDCYRGLDTSLTNAPAALAELSRRQLNKQTVPSTNPQRDS